MNLSSTTFRSPSKSKAPIWIALACVIVLYSVLNFSLLASIPGSLHALAAQAGDHLVRSESPSPLPVPTPPVGHSQAIATPEPVQAAPVISNPVPQPVPTPPLGLP